LCDSKDNIFSTEVQNISISITPNNKIAQKSTSTVFDNSSAWSRLEQL